MIQKSHFRMYSQRNEITKSKFMAAVFTIASRANNPSVH